MMDLQSRRRSLTDMSMRHGVISDPSESQSSNSDLNSPISITPHQSSSMTVDCPGFLDANESQSNSHQILGGETLRCGPCHTPLKHVRHRWPSRVEFLLTLIGYTVGLGNVWRFPYLCQKNGGASFLIPYFIMLVAEGIPLYYMELCIGQRLRQGSIGVWHQISEYLDGVGIASVVVCFLVCLYYNVILAWCLIYLINSFKSPLPWSACPTQTTLVGNITKEVVVPECARSAPTTYFWYRSTLNASASIEESGGINWMACLSLLIIWLLTWFCLLKGIRSTGKVVMVTATMPIFLLAILFFRGVHLDGFQDGLAMLFVPQLSRLQDPLVWLDAATQTFYSLGIAYGSLIAFASYNPLKNDTTRDALLLCMIDAGVSIYASVVIFCFIGYRAQVKVAECMMNNRDDMMLLLNYSNSVLDKTYNIDTFQYNAENINWLQTNVSPYVNATAVFCDKAIYLNETSHSSGLAFITFTDAINTMPNAQMWSILFFLMLVTLGIDTQFGMLEGIITPMLDANLFPTVRIEVQTGAICLILFLLGLPMVQNSGLYWQQLIENYCSGIPLLIIALVECLSLSYIYGMPKFSEDIEYMTNKRPRSIWLWCWKFISPLTIVIVLVFSITGLSKSTPVYQVWDAEAGKVIENVQYPPWAIFIGITLTLVSVAFIPLFALLHYFRVIDSTSNDNVRLIHTPQIPRKDHYHMSNTEIYAKDVPIELLRNGKHL